MNSGSYSMPWFVLALMKNRDKRRSDSAGGISSMGLDSFSSVIRKLVNLLISYLVFL